MAYTANQQQFITAAMPHAMRVSKATGIDPRLIVAQAAHESNWGNSAPGNNYFGIKSHNRPGGQQLATTENVNGQNVRTNASFRQYGDMGQSFDDYGKFLQRNPRYAKVLAAPDLPSQIAAMGSSGYATDANYAGKLSKIANNIGVPDGATTPVAVAGNAPQGQKTVLVNPYAFAANRQLYSPPDGLLSDAPSTPVPAANVASATPAATPSRGLLGSIADAIVSPAAAADNPPIPLSARVNTAADSAKVGNPANPVYAPEGLIKHAQSNTSWSGPHDTVTRDFRDGSAGLGYDLNPFPLPWKSEYGGWLNAQQKLEERSRPPDPLVATPPVVATPAVPTPVTPPPPAPVVPPAPVATATPPAVPMPAPSTVVPQTLPGGGSNLSRLPDSAVVPATPAQTAAPTPVPQGLLSSNVMPPDPNTVWSSPDAVPNVTAARALGVQKPPITAIPKTPAQTAVPDVPRSDIPSPDGGITVPGMFPDPQTAPAPAFPQPGPYDFARAGLLGNGPQLPSQYNPNTQQGPQVITPPAPAPNPDVPAPNAVIAGPAPITDPMQQSLLDDPLGKSLGLDQAAADAQKRQWANTLSDVTRAGMSLAQMGNRGPMTPGHAPVPVFNHPQAPVFALQRTPFIRAGGPTRGLLG